ncbi:MULTISPECIES: 5-dehydro-4-deoxy-D-glucuronate isomerase [unclassified Chelatococcus]|uniref:5-dehydro-4-deoxy-D-glucuronate isomerase n=1 Tax=unclassified Chelatococcus TaxID=2638111 RepID=UPI001BCD9DE6|nr:MULTISPECIES: 5-dehydro-4-deoxy-D-glucuronate isomerase [unclassified Chelatococcus]MBS7700415.1 5-dehydro-4-deoxy-D-glucuronate isomerase [Chelatococcus sp. YT9]MBX3556211.1 5-dehydro-4-deoxy-D-glucuronate isomerase [Chelatococcus sp.]
MTIEIRQVSHPEAVRGFDTAELRRHFLIETLFVPGEVRLTYSHLDRVIVGGAMPTAKPVVLPTPKAVGTDAFLKRRELGIVNVGASGKVSVGGRDYVLAKRDALYVGKEAGEVSFASEDASDPAKFYLLSTPAHAVHQTRVIREADAKTLALGEQETANKRTIRQYIIPGICETCQLVMGVTTLENGSIWNTMPSHTHDRRCEIYLYFDIPADARVFHLMGEPQETRHLIVANEQAVLSPGWSIHSGVGTKAYSFIWGMGGDNVDYTDMDMIATGDLR